MAKKTKTLIERLQEVMRWELAGCIQYLHHATVLTGPQRLPYADFFLEGSKEARDHAELVATKLTALGGMPVTDPQAITTATSLEEMLLAALSLEQRALAAWESALEVAASANPGTQFWIEEMIAHEQEHVDELLKLTGGVSVAIKESKRKAG